MPDHVDPTPNNATATTAAPATKEPTIEEIRAVAEEILCGRVVVKNRAFLLRTGIPDALPVTAFCMPEVDIVAKPDVPAHVRMMRETRGEAKGLIPADREMFELLRDNGIVGEKLTAPHERRTAVIPAGYLRVMATCMVNKRRKQLLRSARNAGAPAAAKANAAATAAAADDDDDDAASNASAAAADDDQPVVDPEEWLKNPLIAHLDRLVLVGPVFTGQKSDPAYILTLGEATLKSRMHLLQMSNALANRVQDILGPEDGHWIVTRCGATAMHIHPIRANFPEGATVLEMRQQHPIDLATLSLVPGIARIYDPWTEPAKVAEAKKALAELEIERAARVAAGQPADPEYDADKPVDGVELIHDVHGRPVRFPTQYKRQMLKTMIDQEAKRARHRLIWGEGILDGTGGLPQSRASKALCLMSGGIDSPVAAFQMMNRGCRVDFVHFLNSTSDTAAILAKLTMIAKRLSSIQGRLDMRVVDIAELQNAIIGAVARADRTVVYKQYMLLIAAAVADYELLVTGDSVSQVASQTVTNVSTLYPLTPRAVVSPLAGSNKNDVIDVSRKVGLLELSAMEGADCCQYLMCKTGATLCIGPAKMRAYLAKITGIASLPVKVLAFDNGEAVPDATYTEHIPFDHIKASLQVPVGAPLAKALFNSSSRSSRRHAWINKNPQAAAAAAEEGLIPGGIVDSPAPGSESTSQLGSPTAASPATAASDVFAAAAAIAEKRKQQTVYMDSAAATIIDPAVQEAISRAPVGNPNSLHTIGRVCRAAVEGVRHQLLSFLCPSLATPFKLAFTSGGTEANNIAIGGLASMLRTGDEALGKPAVLLYSSVAHPSIIEVCKKLAANGKVALAEAVPVRPDGHLDIAALEKLLAKYSAFKNGGLNFTDGRGTRQEDSRPWANVALAFDVVNHELGTLRDGAAIAKLCRAHGALVHADACQALCKVDVDATLYDAVAVTAHKINGPTGIGAVAVRAKLVAAMEPVMAGGSFDGEIRPGTLNAPGIVGFGAALSLHRDEEHAAMVFESLVSSVEALGADAVRINGTPRQSSGRILHMTLTGASPALRKMDDAEIVGYFATRHNVMLSTGAACSQHKSGDESSASNLYTRLGVSPGPTLRVSIDHNTSKADVARFMTALNELLTKIK
eukprot:CAMPEP_0174840270 /NCGR_PEP_ID=MMETSP1114-20130205/8589_1 /TAXON_ID=312471 /ORGANISM="Neobodo designis, Strain CCAP 1951/1" /LENGTH=1142 /DNA_ID=CAMNT_0016074415 /DNA_START=211 /DNA_END=3639 /DNA_ORIENTATION=+